MNHDFKKPSVLQAAVHLISRDNANKRRRRAFPSEVIPRYEPEWPLLKYSVNICRTDCTVLCCYYSDAPSSHVTHATVLSGGLQTRRHTGYATVTNCIKILHVDWNYIFLRSSVSNWGREREANHSLAACIEPHIRLYVAYSLGPERCDDGTCR
jgi:hypothetical protein